MIGRRFANSQRDTAMVALSARRQHLTQLRRHLTQLRRQHLTQLRRHLTQLRRQHLTQLRRHLTQLRQQAALKCVQGWRLIMIGRRRANSQRDAAMVALSARCDSEEKHGWNLLIEQVVAHEWYWARKCPVIFTASDPLVSLGEIE